MDLSASLPAIGVDEFFAAELRVGRILRAEPFPKARNPAYKLLIDFGPLGRKQSSAQITALYAPGDLVGRLVVAVVNFPPRQIADFRSEVLVLGASDADGHIVLLHPEREVPLGARIQ